MAQGKYKKLMAKKARKGLKGYPIATVALYGPTNVVATKLVCGIIQYEGAEAEPMKKWFSERDVRKSEKILGEALVRIPDQTGHRFQFKLDTHSGLNWTPIPVQTGQ